MIVSCICSVRSAWLNVCECWKQMSNKPKLGEVEPRREKHSRITKFMALDVLNCVHETNVQM